MDQVKDSKNTDEMWLERIALKEAVSRLTPREQKILSMRFYQSKTQMEVSEEIGISQAQTVDGGDFSSGSLVQTLSTTRAAELVTLGAMGYDAVTVGNHEFDNGPLGFGEMLTAAEEGARPCPPWSWPTTARRRTTRTAWTSSAPWPHMGCRSTCFGAGGVTYGIFRADGSGTPTPAPPPPALSWRTRPRRPAGV